MLSRQSYVLTHPCLKIEIPFVNSRSPAEETFNYVSAFPTNQCGGINRPEYNVLTGLWVALHLDESY